MRFSSFCLLVVAVLAREAWVRHNRLETVVSCMHHSVLPDGTLIFYHAELSLVGPYIGEVGAGYDILYYPL